MPPLSQLSATLLVTGVPSSASDTDVRALFSSYGQVTHVNIGLLQGKPNGTAQVRFRSPVSELRPGASLALMGSTVRTRWLPCPTIPQNRALVPPSNTSSSTAPAHAWATNTSETAPPSTTAHVASTQPAPSSSKSTTGADTAVEALPAQLAFPSFFAPQAVPATAAAAATSVEPTSAPAGEDLPSLPDSFCISDSGED